MPSPYRAHALALCTQSTPPSRSRRRRRCHLYSHYRASLWLSAAATGLLQHVRPPQVALAAEMLTMIDEVPDPVGAISALLQVRRAAVLRWWGRGVQAEWR
jgi:hypothetical protein